MNLKVFTGRKEKIGKMNSQLPVLDIRNLSKRFNADAGFFAREGKFVYAVNDVSFCIERGKTYALVGESGCGKTTTARLLIQMYRQDSGKILYSDGLSEERMEISSMSKKNLRSYREKVKYIFRDPARSLNPRMNVLDILTAPLKYSSFNMTKGEMYDAAEKIIRETGLAPDTLMRRPAEFSGGQRQRISIARGLIMNPELLICDEIVSALDVSIQAQILDLLLSVRAERKLSLLFITHDLKIASYFCDKIGVMFRGILVEEAPAKTLYKTQAHPYTKLLFEGASKRLSNSSVEIKSAQEKESGCPFAYRCPHAASRCRNELPHFKTVADGHKVRCFANL